MMSQTNVSAIGDLKEYSLTRVEKQKQDVHTKPRISFSLCHILAQLQSYYILPYHLFMHVTCIIWYLQQLRN